MPSIENVLPYNDNDITVAAKTEWAEARGEPHDGKLAVAWVLRNRAERSAFTSLAGGIGALAAICWAPAQFSCWNDDGTPESQRAKMNALPEDQYAEEHDMISDVVEGLVADITGGADHYFTVAKPADVAVWPPTWAASMQPCGQFGSQLFYDSEITDGVHVLYEGCPFSDQIKLLQSALKTMGFLSAEPDGVFGPVTKEAVEEVQGWKTITVDGVVGPETRNALGLN